MKKSIRIALAAVVILVSGALLLRKFVIPAVSQAVLSTLGFQFPAATWDNQSSLMIAANNGEQLNAAWERLQSLRNGSPIEDHFVEVGKLNLPSAELFATDINFPADNVPFRLKVTPGQYPVFESHQTSGSFVAVQVSDEQPVTWVVADSFNDAASVFESSDGVWGISLDSSAILVDGLACKKQLTYNPTDFFDVTTRSATLEASSGLNILCVELGGVGVHPAFWGINADSEPVVLLIMSSWSRNSGTTPEAKP